MTDSRDALGQLGRLKSHLAAELDEHDVERLVRGGAERRQRRRIRRTLGVGLGVGAAGTAALALLVSLTGRTSMFGGAASLSSPVSPSAVLASAAPAQVPGSRIADVMAFSDASRAIPLEPRTELAIEKDAPERVHLRLDRGKARFEVTRRPERSFTVRAGGVTVSVIGTTFGVEMVADRVHVAVERGMVEVDWGLGQTRLVAGESGWFPPLVVSGQVEAVPAGSAAASGTPMKAADAAEPSGSGKQSVQDLLTLVDAARSGRQPERAVELLRRILKEYPRDPRTPLAAFTLGRVLLNELGRPREAAVAFQQVRQRAPTSSFAEDALAREVEAWSRASEPERARVLAKTYLERYPSGRHARRLKTLAGLE